MKSGSSILENNLVLLENESEIEFEENKPLLLSMDYSDSDNLEHQSTSDLRMTLRKKTLRIEVENFLKKKRKSPKCNIESTNFQNENSRNTEENKTSSLSEKSDTGGPQSSQNCGYGLMRLHCPKCIKDLSLKDTIYVRSVPEKCKICLSKLRYGCKKCNHMLNSRSGIQNHIKLGCKDSPKFQCANCLYKTCWKDNLIRHLSSKHGLITNMNVSSRLKCSDETVKFYCPKCKIELTIEETANRLDSFLKYCKRCDTNILLNCKQCNRVYKNKNTMTKHINFHCDQSPRFICQQCNYRTHYAYNLKTHMRNKHNPCSIIYNKCPKCGKRVKDISRHTQKCKIEEMNPYIS